MKSILGERHYKLWCFSIATHHGPKEHYKLYNHLTHTTLTKQQNNSI